MALATFDNATYKPIHPSGERSDRPTIVVQMAGGGAEQRAAVLSRKLKRYELRFRKGTALKAYIDTFFEARGFTAESFLWKDLDDYARTAVALGTGTGAQTVWTIPAVGTYGGDYPVNDSNAILKVNGTPVSKTVQTDNRTLTAAVAPGLGTAVTADYHYYRRVRLLEPYSWIHGPYGVWSTEIVLVEVPQT